MTFNIRYGTAKDGENAWLARRAMVFDVIREQDADVIGLQEALDFQIDEILAAMPAYASIGVGRDDAAARGEFAAILFRKNRFRIAEQNPAIATTLGPFVDTYRVVRPAEKPAGTFTAFTFGKLDGETIDYVLAQPRTEVLSADIVRFSRGGRYPSDYFPVVARIRLREPD